MKIKITQEELEEMIEAYAIAEDSREYGVAAAKKRRDGIIAALKVVGIEVPKRFVVG